MARESTILMATAVALALFGTLMVFSALAFDPGKAHTGPQQTLYFVMGLVAMLLAMRFDYRHFKNPALYRPILLIGMVMLVAVLLFGPVVDGRKSMLRIGAFALQPIELAKFVLVVWLAVKLTDNRDKMQQFFQGFLPPLLFAGALVLLVIALHNVSMSAVLVLTSFVVLFIAGARWSFLAVCLLPSLATGTALIVLAPYRMARLSAYLDPFAHSDGAGWQLIQAFTALTQGGLWGRGIGGSVKTLVHVPNAQTDFVFAALGEQLGMAGMLTVLLLFALFLWVGFRIALNAGDRFGSLLAVGIVALVGTQTVLHLFVNTGMLPTIGTPLPFVSYGGNALVVFMGMVGVLANIGRQSPAPEAITVAAPTAAARA